MGRMSTSILPPAALPITAAILLGAVALQQRQIQDLSQRLTITQGQAAMHAEILVEDQAIVNALKRLDDAERHIATDEVKLDILRNTPPEISRTDVDEAFGKVTETFNEVDKHMEEFSNQINFRFKDDEERLIEVEKRVYHHAL